MNSKEFDNLVKQGYYGIETQAKEAAIKFLEDLAKALDDEKSGVVVTDFRLEDARQFVPKYEKATMIKTHNEIMHSPHIRMTIMHEEGSVNIHGRV